MLLDITSPMNKVINDQLPLNLFNNCLDCTQKVSSRSLLRISKNWKIDKIATVWLVKF